MIYSNIQNKYSDIQKMTDTMLYICNKMKKVK